MYFKLTSFILIAIASVSFAEVKQPGQVVPSRCGQNQIKFFAPGGISEVCMADVVGETGHFLTVFIDGGVDKGTHIYKHKMTNKMNECQNGVAGISCTRVFVYLGTVSTDGFMVLDLKSNVKQATVHSTFGSINYLKSDDLIGSVFESDDMGIVAVTQ